MRTGGRNLIWQLREVLIDRDNPGSAVQESAERATADQVTVKT
jgi:hypothetical protein